MKNIAKYLKKIDESLETLVKNRDLIIDAKKNLSIINNLEEEINKNKNIKIETIDLVNQVIAEIEKITLDNKEKSK